jgi:hypothetical protein
MSLIIIISIIALGVIAWYLHENFFKSKDIIFTPTPFINPIPNFILRTGNSNWVQNIIDKNINNDNIIEWDGNMDNIINPIETDNNKLAVQFRFFAEYWLNILNVNNGYTIVIDSLSELGKYEFSRNKNNYTAKFNNAIWNWTTTPDYCFNTINAKRENNCMGNWIFNNKKCYPPGTSSSTCNNYDWNTMFNYSKQDDINSWMTKCNVTDSQDCKYRM